MSLYLFLNILIIIFPLSLSFERKIEYYRKILPVLASIILVSSIFIIWDLIATYRGDWGFNLEYISGLKLFNLPVEEILFFLTVPFSILFIYETVIFYIPDNKIYYNKTLYTSAAVFFLIISVLNFSRYYTFTVFLFTALFIIITMLWFDEIFRSRNYWLFILISYAPFLIFNYILTSLPVVWYASQSILGIRIITIPIEDFFYSYSLISAYLLVYLFFKEKWLQRKVRQ